MPKSFDIKDFDCIFRDISTSIHPRTHAKDIARLVVQRVTERLMAKGAIIRILNPLTEESEVAVSYGLSELFLNKGPVSWDRIIKDLHQAGDILIIKDIGSDPRVQYPKETMREGIQMIVDMALTLEDHTVGVMRIYFTEQRELEKEEIDYLTFTSHQGACAIEKAGLIENQQRNYDHLAIQTEKLSALGRMAAGIAHEINNPLAGILLYSSNMLKKIPEDGPLKEGLEVVINETKRCKTIIQELLEFSREGEPRTVPANINEVIEKALSILANVFHLQHIHVEKDLGEPMGSILIDETQIEQVFINLLLNAVQAIGKNGTIHIQSRIDPVKDLVKVSIKDSGCGIPEEDLPKIFEPFFSTKTQGTGLGLSVSYGIMQNHKAGIQAVSRPGAGAEFILEFPLSP